jgi:AcrR family transcriptional regulator
MSDSRAVLLEAAAREFAKNGPKGTRVQDIVQAAGVNERMIYHHFGSKDGLYRAVMEDQRMRLGTAWWPILEKAATLEPHEGMRLALNGFFDVVLDMPQAAALLMHEALGDTPIAIPAGVTGLPEPVRSLYERGQADGTFPAEVSFEVAYAVAVSTLVAMCVFAPRFTGFVGFIGVDLGADRVQLRDQVVGQVLNGMTG